MRGWVVLLAARGAQRFSRHASQVPGIVAGIGLGFLFFVADGMVLALGESGALPPLVAEALRERAQGHRRDRDRL